MKKKNNKNYTIVSLFIVVLSLAVGYAIFAESLNITGTAQTTGSFDVEFSSATVTNQTLSSGASTNISGDKNTLTLAAPDLQLPGATVTYNVIVKNVGNIDAELLEVVPIGGTDPDVPVTFPTFTVGTILEANGEYQFDIVVEWDADSSTGDKNINYSVELNYQQAA